MNCMLYLDPGKIDKICFLTNRQLFMGGSPAPVHFYRLRLQQRSTAPTSFGSGSTTLVMLFLVFLLFNK